VISSPDYGKTWFYEGPFTATEAKEYIWSLLLDRGVDETIRVAQWVSSTAKAFKEGKWP
jgi:hypothetical protein